MGTFLLFEIAILYTISSPIFACGTRANRRTGTSQEPALKIGDEEHDPIEVELKKRDLYLSSRVMAMPATTGRAGSNLKLS